MQASGRSTTKHTICPSSKATPKLQKATGHNDSVPRGTATTRKESISSQPSPARPRAPQFLPLSKDPLVRIPPRAGPRQLRALGNISRSPRAVSQPLLALVGEQGDGSRERAGPGAFVHPPLCVNPHIPTIPLSVPFNYGFHFKPIPSTELLAPVPARPGARCALSSYVPLGRSNRQPPKLARS